MKKLLLIALLSLVGLGSVADAFGLFGVRRRAARRGARYGYGYGHYGAGSYRGGYAVKKSCGDSCEPCVEECSPPPCCEREETIKVLEAPRKVCGWVCPDGTKEIPAAEARHADY